MCDGGLQLLDNPNDLRALVQSLHRMIAAGGLCVIRLFSAPPEQESPEQVFADLFARKIGNLNLLKLRLGMALADGDGQCVRLRQVWDAINNIEPDFLRLAEKIGWPLEHLFAINTYRERHMKYFFLRAEQVTDAFCHTPGGFELMETHIPEYEMGDRCPILTFRRN